MAAGYVYVMANPALRADLLKIGRTDRDPFARARELHTTGLPQPFRVLLAVYVEDSPHLERHLHLTLQHKRVNAGREFFNCSLGEVIVLISTYFDSQERRGNAWSADPRTPPEALLAFDPAFDGVDGQDLADALEGDGLDIVDFALEEEHGPGYFRNLKERVFHREPEAYQELVAVCCQGSKRGKVLLRSALQDRQGAGRDSWR